MATANSFLQSTSMDFAKHHNLWWLSGNAAGLTIQGLPQHGLAGVELLHTDGAFRRPQQAENQRRWKFSTEKFTELDNLHVWGAFSYTHQSDNNLRWTDVLYPYSGNPYIFADDRGGDWNKQFFNMAARLASQEVFGFLRYGASVSYQVGSGARQNDPRPLNRLKDLTFSPSAIIGLGVRTSLGLTFNYREFREDISIRIRNRDDNFRYYHLLGLGEYHSAFMTTYSRFCEGNTIGGALQFNLSGNGYNWLSSAGIDFRNETIVDGGTSGQKAGDFSQFSTELGSSILWSKPGLNHKLNMRLSFSQGFGTEFVQEYDPAEFIWFTVFSTVRTDISQMNGQLGYTVSMPDGVGGYAWLYDVSLYYTQRNFIYRNPRSELLHDQLRVSLQTHRYVGNDKRLLLSVGMEGGFAMQGELIVDPYLEEVGRDIVLNQVTRPDFDYLTTDFAAISAALSRAFSFTLHRPVYTHIEAGLNYVHPFSDTFDGGRTYIQLGVVLNY